MSQWKDIFEAAQHKDISGVKYFVESEHTQLSSIEPHSIQTAAHIASRNGDLDTLKYLLGKEPSVLKIHDIFFHTIFSLAIAQGHLDVIKYLVEELEVDIHEPDDLRFGNTGIHEAAEQGQLQILKYFLQERNGDINVVNEFGEPPVFLAAEKPHMHIIVYLVEETNAKLTMTDEFDDNILFISARKGDLILPKYLLDERRIRFDINWRNKMGATVTYRATRFNHFHLLRYFVSQKHADVNICDISGRSPLYQAARFGYVDIVKYLFNHGANPQKKDIHGDSPLLVASQRQVVKYLKGVVLQRHRRHVSQHSYSEEISESCKQLQRLVSEEPRAGSYIGGKAVRVDRVNFYSRLGSFLILASTCFSYFTKNGYMEHKNRPNTSGLLSLREIIESKIDPVAVDVASGFYFQNLYEN